jgi:hypothetical protein
MNPSSTSFFEVKCGNLGPLTPISSLEDENTLNNIISKNKRKLTQINVTNYFVELTWMLAFEVQDTWKKQGQLFLQ